MLLVFDGINGVWCPSDELILLLLGGVFKDESKALDLFQLFGELRYPDFFRTRARR